MRYREPPREKNQLKLPDLISQCNKKMHMITNFSNTLNILYLLTFVNVLANMNQQ